MSKSRLKALACRTFPKSRQLLMEVNLQRRFQTSFARCPVAEQKSAHKRRKKKKRISLAYFECNTIPVTQSKIGKAYKKSVVGAFRGHLAPLPVSGYRAPARFNRWLPARRPDHFRRPAVISSALRKHIFVHSASAGAKSALVSRAIGESCRV